MTRRNRIPDRHTRRDAHWARSGERDSSIFPARRAINVTSRHRGTLIGPAHAAPATAINPPGRRVKLKTTRTRRIICLFSPFRSSALPCRGPASLYGPIKEKHFNRKAKGILSLSPLSPPKLGGLFGFAVRRGESNFKNHTDTPLMMTYSTSGILFPHPLTARTRRRRARCRLPAHANSTKRNTSRLLDKCFCARQLYNALSIPLPYPMRLLLPALLTYVTIIIKRCVGGRDSIWPRTERCSAEVKRLIIVFCLVAFPPTGGLFCGATPRRSRKSVTRSNRRASFIMLVLKK